jgi:hypothetical protein
MKRFVQIYIEGVPDSNDYSKIELFDEQAIDLSMSVQNIADISKTFTDFTKSFTVPASPINNAIFKHFYNSDVDTTLQHGVKRNAYIEIEQTPFRSGRIQIEDSSVVNGKVSSYTITFYGNLTSLKDMFGVLKLKDLDYSDFTSPFTGDEVKDRISLDATDYDIRYPLISSKRLWSYGDSTATDINTTGGHILYSELFPAIKVIRIFDAIESMFGVNFSGIFLGNKKFTNCFLYCKNKDVNDSFNQSQIMDISSASANLNLFTTTFTGHSPITPDYTTNIINLQYLDVYGWYTTGAWNISVKMFNVSNLSANYYFDVYVDGVLVHTSSGIGTDVEYLVWSFDNDTSLNSDIYIVIRADAGITFDSYIKFQADLIYYDDSAGTGAPIPTPILINYYLYCTTQTLSANTDINSIMPDMTIADFFSGVLKEFNLTCYALALDTFQIEPLEDWYNKGKVHDITTYTTTESIIIERIKLFKTISFTHADSESFLNKKYFELNSLKYGDVKTATTFDGADFAITVPFENLIMQKFTGTDLQVGYCLTKEPDYKPYIPKPILLYMYDKQNCSFKFNNGVTTTTVSTYMPFGQDMKLSGVNYSLNFGNDNSSLLLEPIENSLYKVYYEPYLLNLFNNKNRLTKVKCVFPLSLITKLKLNDRLIIRDKRYIINEIKSDITKGIVDLVLLNDFRSIRSKTWSGGKPFKTDYLGGDIHIGVLMKGGTKSCVLSSTTAGVTFSESTIYTDTEVTVTIPTVTANYFTLIGEDNSKLIDETHVNLRSELGDSQLISIDLLYTNDDDTTESLSIPIIQTQ